ncbi:MAG: hypothetical protein ACRCY0_04810, partial [Synechococcus elongatus]|uniref:hypothetical protein n=1 Tax=Synechococcus elongatus TaxID=32046 RepID=UPI003F3FA24A
MLLGDFNINWLNNQCRKKLKDIMTRFQMTQIIKGPTRIAKSSQTLIDLVFVNKCDRIMKIYNLITGISDHNLTLVSRKLTKEQYKNQKLLDIKRYFTYITKQDREKLENEIKMINWSHLTLVKDTEQACDNFKTSITQTINKFTKIKQKRQNGKISLPWFTDELWQLMKKRDAALKRAIKSKLITDHLIYKSLRNKVISQIRKAKANYFLDHIRQAHGNTRKLWKTIDKLMGKDQYQNE